MSPLGGTTFDGSFQGGSSYETYYLVYEGLYYHLRL